MTILTTIQTCFKRMGLQSPSSVIGNTDNDVVLMLAKLEEAGRAVRDSAPWPELQIEYTFTTSASVASYAMPADISIKVFETDWDRTNHWPLIGPISPQEWQDKKSGISTTTPRSLFRIKGFADKQMFIHPTPTSTVTLVFEYQTKTWLRPKTWVTATVFAANSYSFYNGNIYQTAAGGTTGATPPTHTSGSVSDGTVTWTYISAAYENVVADTDIVLLDEETLVLNTIWRFKRENGFAHEEDKAEAISCIDQQVASLSGAGVVSFGPASRAPFGVGPWSVPDGGWG